MDLVEKLEKRARELDQQLKYGLYDERAYNDRELLEQAVKYIRGLEAMDLPFVGDPADFCGITAAMRGVKNV